MAISRQAKRIFDGTAGITNLHIMQFTGWLTFLRRSISSSFDSSCIRVPSSPDQELHSVCLAAASYEKNIVQLLDRYN